MAIANAETLAEDDHRRSRRDLFAWRTIRADFLSKIVNIVVRLLSIGMAIRLLGNEKYGLWLASGTLLAWINLSQLGMGGGLINELGKAFGRNDRAGMRRLISTAYVALAVIALIALAILLILDQSGLVSRILGLERSPHLIPDARVVFIITSFLLAATILVNTCVSVCMGLQEGYLYFSFLSVSNLLALGVLALMSFWHAGLPAYTLGMGLPPVVMMVALTIYQFGWRHPDIAPGPSHFDRGALKALLSFGGPLVLAQVGDMMIFNSATPLIASSLGMSEVARYGVAFALFMNVVNICDGISGAYLGGYTEANARQDWGWIRRIVNRTRQITFGLAAAAGIGIVLLGPLFIRLWAGKTVIPSQALLACMAVYVFLMVCSKTNTVLVLGLGNARLKAVTQLVVAGVHFAGFFLLVGRLGLLAIPVAGAVGYLFDIAVSYTYSTRYLKSRQTAQLTGTGQPHPEMAGAA